MSNLDRLQSQTEDKELLLLSLIAISKLWNSIMAAQEAGYIQANNVADHQLSLLIERVESHLKMDVSKGFAKKIYQKPGFPHLLRDAEKSELAEMTSSKDTQQ